MRHFTLLLLSVFTVYQAKADILIPLDKYPTGEKQFPMRILARNPVCQSMNTVFAVPMRQMKQKLFQRIVDRHTVGM